MMTMVMALTLMAAGALAEPAEHVLAQTTPPVAQSFLDEAPVRTSERPHSAVQAIAIACVVLAMAAGGWVTFNRAQSRGRTSVPGDKITLLAFKPIGGRQRLALVEVCGERLLLAANEREVTLLSHLPGAQEAEVALEADGIEAREAARSSAPPPRGQTVAAMEHALAQGAREADIAPAAAFSADLAGLHRWQEHAHNEREA